MKKLLIPEKIILNRQIVPGMGKMETRQLLTAALPGLTLGFLLFFNLENPGSRLLCLALGFLYCGGCYGLFVRVEGGLSIYIYLKRIWHFHQGQKDFYYKHEKEALRYVGKEKQP